MSDEKRFSEEEYQFTEEEAGDVYAPERKTVRSWGFQDPRTRVLVAIGIIILLILLYKMAGYFFGTEIQKQPEAPIIKPEPTSSVVIPQTPQTPQTPQIPQTPAVPERVTTTLLSLQQQQNEQANAIKDIQTKLPTVQNSLNQLTTTLSTLNARIDALQKKVDELSQPKRVEAARPVMRYRPLHRKLVRPITFYVKAMIPGRAWLRNRNGATITVRSGSILQGYGRVLSIDLRQGIVTTSSGRVINYSPEDR